MSGTVYKLNGNFTKKIRDVSELLKNSINEGINAQLVSEVFRTAGSAEIILLNFEKFYFRNGSYAGLTVMLTETEESQTADIAGFGGGEGLLNISWGANFEFAERAAEILKSRGFVRE